MNRLLKDGDQPVHENIREHVPANPPPPLTIGFAVNLGEILARVIRDALAEKFRNENHRDPTPQEVKLLESHLSDESR
jgi:hypothetical protein